jgi:hypothetical protein
MAPAMELPVLVCAVILIGLAAFAGFIGFTLPSAVALMVCLLLTLAAGIALDSRVVDRWRDAHPSRHKPFPG